LTPQAIRPSSARELLPTERRFVTVLQQLGFGHLESVKIRSGEVVLDRALTLVQVPKFGAAESQPPSSSADFELKKSMADLFEYIRGVDDGVIRRLEIRPIDGSPSLRISSARPASLGLECACW
jgi:hypothetical protein